MLVLIVVMERDIASFTRSVGCTPVQEDLTHSVSTCNKRFNLLALAVRRDQGRIAGPAARPCASMDSERKKRNDRQTGHVGKDEDESVQRSRSRESGSQEFNGNGVQWVRCQEGVRWADEQQG